MQQDLYNSHHLPSTNVITDKMYGRCCAGEMDGWGCGGLVGGKTAISYYKDGFFQNGHMESTKWKRGTNQGSIYRLV